MSVHISNTPARLRRYAAFVMLVLPLGAPIGRAATPPDGAVASVLVRTAGSADGRDLGAAGLRPLADRAMSMDEAVDLAQRRYNARVVRAEVAERGGRRVYLLRLLTDDGRVFNVRVDASTGSLQ